MCVVSLFEVPAAVVEVPFDVGFLEAWLLLEDFWKVVVAFDVSFTSPQKLNFVWQALLTSYNKPRKHDTLLKHYYYSLFS